MVRLEVGDVVGKNVGIDVGKLGGFQSFAGHEVCDIVGKIMLGQVPVKSLEFWFGMT